MEDEEAGEGWKLGKEVGGSLERGWEVDEEGRGGLEEAEGDEEAAGRMEKVRRRMRRLEEVWKKVGEGRDTTAGRRLQRMRRVWESWTEGGEGWKEVGVRRA